MHSGDQPGDDQKRPPMDSPYRPMAIGAAMDWEVHAVLEALSRHGAGTTGGPRVWRAACGSTDVLVYRTGVGIKRARRRTRDLISDCVPGLVVNTGCAGALVAGWRTGDVAVATEVVGPPPGSQRSAIAPPIQEALCEVARAAVDATVRPAAVLSVGHVLALRSDKESHGRQWNAQVVEMEGAGVAQAAEEAGGRYVGVRVILDPLEADLPASISSDHDRPSRLSRVARALSSATEISRIAALYRNRRCAEANLTRVYDGLFRALREGTIDPDLLGLR